MPKMSPPQAINRTRAEGAAWKVWDTYGFAHPRDVPLIELAREKKIVVRGGGLKGAEARLVRMGDRGILRVKDQRLDTGRSRFAISHELGHWLLHTGGQGFTCSAKDMRDYKERPQEAEANIFASHLLMPATFVRPFVAARDISMKTAADLATDCNVSLTAASLRMMEMSKYECVLVFSRDRHVVWWSSSTDRFGIWLESKQRLKRDTVAYHLGEADKGDFTEEDVPFDSWFLHYDRPNTPTITEQSQYLSSAQGTLSLLILAE